MQIMTEENAQLSFDSQSSLVGAENNAKMLYRERDHKGRLAWSLVVIKIVIEMLVSSTAS